MKSESKVENRGKDLNNRKKLAEEGDSDFEVPLRMLCKKLVTKCFITYHAA